MAKRKKIIVGNWKMNPPTLAEAKAIFQKVRRTADKLAHVVTVLCPPSIYLGALPKLSTTSRVRFGVQDLFWENDGAFTGQISVAMASDVGAEYAIIGHSEKRKLGETDVLVSKKVGIAIRHKLKVILCVGESERDREGIYLSFLQNQLKASLAGLSKAELGSGLIVAYEPIWEIGRRDMKTMAPHDIHGTAIFIKKVLADSYGREIADSVPILYGGSVSGASAKDVVFKGGVDGLLVGRASLDPTDFGLILKSLNEKL